MSNYSPTGNPVSQTRGTSSLIRSEFLLIQTALNSKADPTVANTFTAANIFNALNTFNAGITVTGAANFTGAVLTATTQAQGDNSTKVATTAYADTIKAYGTATYAPLISPALTGIPTAPTAATADNSTTIANTAHVKAVLGTMPSGTLPAMAANAGKVLQVNSTESGVQWGYGSLNPIAYDSRSTLRSTDGPANAQALVTSLGVFRWVAGSTEPDDDETAFASATGVWELEVPHPDLIDAQVLFDEDYQNDRLTLAESRLTTAEVITNNVIFATRAAPGITSVAASTGVNFTTTVTGARVGDRVLVVPGASFGIQYVFFWAYVSSTNTVQTWLMNSTASIQAVNDVTWKIAVFRSDL